MTRKMNLKRKWVNLLNYSWISEDQKSWVKAKSYIDLLKREIHTFPEFLKKYINKKFHANL